MRTDLRSARASMENVTENLKYYRNQTLPQVNFQLNYGATGLGGTQFLRGEGFPRPIVGQVDRLRSPVLGDVFSANFPTWTVGRAVFSLPARAAGRPKRRSPGTKLEQNQNLLQIKSVEVQVGTAGPRRRAPGEHEPEARRGHARRADARGPPARGGAEEVRRRHVDQLPRVPGAARSRDRARQRAAARCSTTTSRSSTSRRCRRRRFPAVAASGSRAAAAPRDVHRRAATGGEASRRRRGRRPPAAHQDSLRGGTPCRGRAADLRRSSTAALHSLRARLSAIVITINESANIEAALASVSFADEILVVDSESTDETRRHRAGARARG